MATDESQKVEEFLNIRHTLVVAGDVAGLDQHDYKLHKMAATDPDQAAAILDTLSNSGELGAKNAVTLYARALFRTRPEIATELLLALVQDPDPNIASCAAESIDILTRDPLLNSSDAT